MVGKGSSNRKKNHLLGAEAPLLKLIPKKTKLEALIKRLNKNAHFQAL